MFCVMPTSEDYTLPVDRDSLHTAIAQERLGIADLIDNLDETQLATPSLCEGWDVKTVGARALLHVEGDGADAADYALGTTTRIGRAEDNDVCIQSRGLSRTGERIGHHELSVVGQRQGRRLAQIRKRDVAAVALDALRHSAPTGQRY